MVELTAPLPRPRRLTDGVARSVVGAGRVPRSAWRELGAMVPDVLRLLRALLADPRVSRRSKLLAGAAAMYIALPLDPLPDVLPGSGHGVDDLVALVWAVRHLTAAAGYDLVRELWTGTDAGFALLVLIAGVDR
jgi:uncharacterized membrane protein YkvA (DUF1232 family)